MPIDHDKGPMTTVSKSNPAQYNHMFNKTVRSGGGGSGIGNGSQDPQFYNDAGHAPPTSAGAVSQMLVNYSVKGMS